MLAPPNPVLTPPTSIQCARDGGKPEQFAVGEIRRVHHHVIQVLAGDALMIGDDDVAAPKSVRAVAADGVLNDRRPDPHEMRDAAGVLRQQTSFGVQQSRSNSRARRKSSCCTRSAAERTTSRW